MPSLSISYNPNVGPLIQVAVFSPDFSLPAQSSPADPLPMKMYMALIDTGASHTCISTNVVKDLGLQPRGKQPAYGVHGIGATNSYQFQVGLTFPHSQIATGAVKANIIPFLCDGMEFIVSPGSGFDVLMGRDILCSGVFTMSFDGHAILSI